VGILKSFSTAVSLFGSGQFDEAIAECRAILTEQPSHADAWQMIGLALAQTDRKDLAVEPMERSYQLNPRSPALCSNLGELYRQVERLSDAERLLNQALRLQPRFPEAAMNLGNVLRDQGRYHDAITAFEQAVAWRPNYANAHINLANLLWKEGRVKSAIEHYQASIRLGSPRSDVLLSLGGAYADLGDQSNAMNYYLAANRISPDDNDVDAAIGHAWLVQGQVDQAGTCFKRIAAREPQNLLKQLRADSLCKIIETDNRSIDDTRARLNGILDRIDSDFDRLDVDDLHTSGCEPPMALAYQGRDDRTIKERYAALFSRRIQPVDLAPRSGRAKLGVVVTNGHEGVYAECLGRLVARLANRGVLDITVICSRAGANIIPYLLGNSAVNYLPLRDSVAASATLIADARFDLLHYWEVGTDSMNYFLPFFRAAPVQSACWGWPVTTGQKQIEYFVSSRWLEPPNAASHYTERIVPLRTLPTWYARPPVPDEFRSRASFGLSVQGAVYLCTQNLRKYHPDFDGMLAEILRHDPTGTIYVIEDAQQSVSRLLKERFERNYPDVSSRWKLVPRLARAEYLQLVSIVDVVLDTIHYGGGANSIYDAFACGTPIVTLPGAFHRGRYGQGVCQKLNLPELIAGSRADYVTLAVRIAGNLDLRRQLTAKIRERSDELFEDDSAVVQHEEFFLQAIEAARKGHATIE